MADNTTLNNGSGGDTIRDVDRGAAKTPVVGLDLTIGGPSETLMNGSMPCSQVGPWTVTADAGTGSFTVAQSAAGALNATVVGTGTFAVQAAQSGPWTVQPGNAANTTPWLANQSDPSATTGSVTAVDSGTATAVGQGGQSLITGTPTAGSSVAVTLSAHTSVGILITGSWTGTLSFERSMDGGTTYVPMSAFLHGIGGNALSSVTANGFLFANVGACTDVRVRATAAMTGTATIRILPSFGGELVASALLGGTNLVGQVSASDETSTIFNGMSAIVPQFASFTLTSAGATTIIAATAGKRIRILRYSVEFDSTVNFNFQSHVTTSTASGVKYGIANKTSGSAYTPVGVFQTVAGEALDGYLSAAGIVSGELTYVLV